MSSGSSSRPARRRGATGKPRPKPSWEPRPSRRRAAPSVRGPAVPAPDRSRAAGGGGPQAAGSAPPRDPDAERLAIESRALEEWIDEGALRAEATGAASRAGAATPARRPARRQRAVDAETTNAIRARARDSRHAARLVDRFTQAQQALERERFDDARRLATPLLRDLPELAAAHQLVGLAAYRTGRWKQAVSELEAAQDLHPDVELLPVLADAYRALGRWRDVDRIWHDVRAISPAQDVLAEARIVAAGAEADRGDLEAALQTMARAKQVPKRVRDHHLRQWYVLGDLYDRAGDPLEAARWFELVARHDAEFVDVADRLRALGR